MAVQNAQVTVTTAATRLDQTADAGMRSSLVVRNMGTAPVYLGSSTVTTANGAQLDAGESASVDLVKGESLYAVAASGTVRCDVLQAGA